MTWFPKCGAGLADDTAAVQVVGVDTGESVVGGWSFVAKGVYEIRLYWLEKYVSIVH